MAEQNNYNDEGDSFVLSDDILDKIGNDNNFDIDVFDNAKDYDKKKDNKDQQKS